ncbi:Xaa-Pro peptidase family protein [Staphylococcus sp. Marseille-Q5304]|uniref:M24 family metallopeptidase n=1 Tax=Staphylococcus sp. Marseille-Q5304 TaxID=2942200 RepID=UPI0020749FA0|nr:Xaa-Pro peptidase family protein [Staphylococcus sp. Marseille-Q5304]
MKLKQIQSILKEEQAQAAWITTPLNIFYLTGYHSEPHERLFALLIKDDGEQILICPKMEMGEVQNSPFEGKVIGYLDSENPLSKLDSTFDKMLIEAYHLTVARQRELKETFEVNSFADIDQTLRELRNIKSDEEIDKIIKACALADKCIEFGVSYLKEGVTERQVVNYIENEIKAYGVNEMSFDTMVLFGDHAASPHGIPGDRKLQQDEFVLFDLGVVYEHYCSDITRTIPFGNPSDEAKNIYNIVLEAEEKAIAAIKPGVKISDIDKLARDIIAEAGYGEYFTHRLGHGLGLEEHEYQDVSGNNDNSFEAGMVITIEPGIYAPNIAGVRIEDDILVTDDGAISLTEYKK